VSEGIPPNQRSVPENLSQKKEFDEWAIIVYDPGLLH
jgi:hypothetical protein